MYGLISMMFIAIVSFSYYMLSTYNSIQFTTSRIKLEKHINAQNYTIYASCIDRKVLTAQMFTQIKVKSQSQFSYLVLFDQKPYLKCQQLTYGLNIIEIQDQYEIQLDKILRQQQAFKSVQIRKLNSNDNYKIKNDKVYILALNINRTAQTKQSDIKSKQISRHYSPVEEQIQQTSIFKHSSSQHVDQISLSIQNTNYSAPIIRPLFWFGWFNIILISIISYYRKHVFNTKIKLLPSISLLIYLIFIGYHTQYHFQELQKSIKSAMILFLLIICIKTKLSTKSMILMIALSIVNQIMLDTGFNRELNWLIFVINIVNIRQFPYGQNIEVILFSLFSFIIEYGLINPVIDIMNPYMFSIIVVNLIFGPTIYQLLQLYSQFHTQQNKNKQRLHSIQISQSDSLFKK